MLLGSYVYGIYDATNYATFKKWPIYICFNTYGRILFLLIQKYIILMKANLYKNDEIISNDILNYSYLYHYKQIITRQ